MATGRQSKTIRIDAETARAVEAMLAEIPDINRSRGKQFTKTEDAFIRAGWGNKPQIALARKLGICVNTLRRRHDELMEGRG